MRYLLDTNIIAEPTKLQPNLNVINALTHYAEDLAISRIPILPYTQEAGKWFATERSRLTNLGQTPAYADGQIAAIAHINDLILVTRNTSDFIHFDRLILENWFEE